MSNTMSSTPSQTQAAISVQDLQNLLAIVDLATQRGAFRGPELSQVGQVFDRVNQFLQSVMPQDNAAPAAPAAPPQTGSLVPPAPQPVNPPQMMQQPSPVMPMSPPFMPKVGG